MKRKCKEHVAKVATRIIFLGIMLEVRFEYLRYILKRLWKFLKIYFKHGL